MFAVGHIDNGDVRPQAYIPVFSFSAIQITAEYF